MVPVDVDNILIPPPIPDYINRKFANLEHLTRDMVDKKKSFMFLGPKSCGKSATLLSLCHHVKNEGNKVVFINMKLALSPKFSSSSILPEDTILFVDNAQMLGNESPEARIVRLLRQFAKCCCYAFSSLVFSERDSIVKADCHGCLDIRFRPFTEDEFEEWASKKGIQQPDNKKRFSELSAQIPIVLNRLQQREFTEVQADRILSSMFADQFSSLHSRLRNSQEELSAFLLQILRAAMYVRASLLIHEWEFLCDQGFVYADAEVDPSSPSYYQLVYPRKIMLQHLGKQMTKLYTCLAEFAKGAAFEILVLYNMECFPHTATRGDKKEEINIPICTDVYFQRHFEFPSRKIGKCTIIKLSENHPAIDFLILDDTRLEKDSCKLFLVQVSIKSYQNRGANEKYSAVNRKQINGKSVKQYYTNLADVKECNCTYLFISSAESHIEMDATDVYTIVIF